MSKSGTAKKLASELSSELAASLVDIDALSQQRPFVVSPIFASVLPRQGLQRGTTIMLGSSKAQINSGALSLALALVAEAVRSGALLAVVADETFNLSACYDHGIPISKVVCFSLDSDAQSWAQSLAAIIDGFDLVLLVKEPNLRTVLVRRIMRRVQERNAVLVRVSHRPWGQSPDLEMGVETRKWQGLGKGWGYLNTRNIEVSLTGRRSRGRKQSFTVTLPLESGGDKAQDPISRYESSGRGDVIALQPVSVTAGDRAVNSSDIRQAADSSDISVLSSAAIIGGSGEGT